MDEQTAQEMVSRLLDDPRDVSPGEIDALLFAADRAIEGAARLAKRYFTLLRGAVEYDEVEAGEKHLIAMSGSQGQAWEHATGWLIAALALIARTPKEKWAPLRERERDATLLAQIFSWARPLSALLRAPWGEEVLFYQFEAHRFLRAQVTGVASFEVLHLLLAAALVEAKEINDSPPPPEAIELMTGGREPSPGERWNPMDGYLTLTPWSILRSLDDEVARVDLDGLEDELTASLGDVPPLDGRRVLLVTNVSADIQLHNTYPHAAEVRYLGALAAGEGEGAALYERLKGAVRGPEGAAARGRAMLRFGLSLSDPPAQRGGAAEALFVQRLTTGHFEHAERVKVAAGLFERAITELSNGLGANDPATLEATLQLAMMRYTLADNRAAEPLLERCAAEGAPPAIAARALHALAAILDEERRLEDLAAVAERGAAFAARTDAADRRRFTDWRASVLRARGDRAGEAALLRASLSERAELLGPDNPHIARLQRRIEAAQKR